MRMKPKLLALTLLLALPCAAGNLGKIFIKAAPIEAGQVEDPGLVDTVNDLKLKHGDFVVANDESEADFLLVVTDRHRAVDRFISATLSVRENGAWKPTYKLTQAAAVWRTAAYLVMRDAAKRVKELQKKNK